MSATTYASRPIPSRARASACSSGEIGGAAGRPLGTNATGAARTQRRSLRSSARETAATPRVKLPRMRATASYKRTATVLQVSPWKVATTGTRAIRPAKRATKSDLKS